MSTRSLVGIQNKNGTVNFIYVHSDGYTTGVGKTLLENYSSRKKIRKLVNLGDLSSLGEVIGRKRPFDLYSLYPNMWSDPQVRAAYEADKRTHYCLAYGRDRGESDVGTKTVDNADDFRKYSAGTEYWYFKAYRGEWQISSRGIGREFVPLKDELKKEITRIEDNDKTLV